MKPSSRKTLRRFLPIVFDLERANQLSLLPDKDLVDLCHPIEPYQVTKNRVAFLSFNLILAIIVKPSNCPQGSFYSSLASMGV
jgi:hypothetical protein